MLACGVPEACAKVNVVRDLVSENASMSHRGENLKREKENKEEYRQSRWIMCKPRPAGYRVLVFGVCLSWPEDSAQLWQTVSVGGMVLWQT